uniref:Leucine-rich repeat and IQ domain-containing protein 1 n=1 Tax=Leptobrachium leishanense TaxID=445787 RepID=A0A8C5QNQ5_9ANUR
MEDIELELRGISLPEGTENENEEEDHEAIENDGETEVSDDVPESMLLYFKALRRRTENTELFLEDLGSSDHWLSHHSESVINPYLDYTMELTPENKEQNALGQVLTDEKKKESTMRSSMTLLSNRQDYNIIQETVTLGKLDAGDSIITFDYLEVEERCRQKLQEWEDEQDKHRGSERDPLNSQTDITEKQNEEVDWRGGWRIEFEKQASMLDSFHKEQEKMFEEELQKQKEALAEDLKIQQEMIVKRETEMKKEIEILEEQRAQAKKRLKELQHKSAVRIQAQFRAFHTYKKYSPVLRERKKDRQKKRELQLKLEQERKEMEERTKRKLEEKKSKDEEKKQKEEADKRALEEVETQERLWQEARQREYEKKKEKERLRLEKEKLLKEQKNKELEKRPKTSAEIVLEGNHAEIEKNDTKIKGANEVIENMSKSGGRYSHHVEEKHIEKLGVRTLRDVRVEGNVEVIKTISKEVEIKSVELDSVIPTSPNANINRTCDSTGLPEQGLPRDKLICSMNPSADTFIHKNMDVEQGKESLLSPRNTEVQQPAAAIALSVNIEAQKEQKEDSTVSVLSRSLVLPDHIEEKRLSWMRSCRPWSKILRDNKRKKIIKRKQRKSSAAKKLPPLNENLVFQNSACRHLQQVTTVTLQDLPGCSIATLSNCAKLRYLSMRRCGLIAIDSLRDCNNLQYIDVQENSINIVNCEDMENLNVLLLNKNQITSIHGLENCINLMNLELSSNLITRIGGLESLRSLQRLVLDHNQLISTRGLEAVPTLMYLDCSSNFLTEFEGIQNCCLLQILKLRGNNLCEVPKLENHVLLQELYLDDNSISALKGLSLYWLPLLQVLTLSHNSLAQLEPLDTFVSLEELDISNNCLSDMQSLRLWLDRCVSLQRLSLGKNPLMLEANWRSTLLNILPGIRLLNNEHLESNAARHRSQPGSFLAFCQTQIQIFRKLWKTLNQDEGSCTSFERLEKYCNTLKELMEVSSERRYAHEYGDIEDMKREDPEILENNVEQSAIDRSQHNGLVISGANDNKQEDPIRQIASRQRINSHADPKGSDQVEILGKESRKKKVTWDCNNTADEKNDINDCETMKMPIRPAPVGKSKHSAAVIIQSHWRGYAVRREINYYAKLHEAASIIQCAWRSFSSRKIILRKKKTRKPISLDVKYDAATLIQAVWKGFLLRKKLAAAFAAIERDMSDEEEVNLGDFIFDEDASEKGWALNSTNVPSATLHLSNGPEQLKFHQTNAVPEGKVWRPVEAWQDPRSPEADSVFTYDRIDNDSRLEKQSMSHSSKAKSSIDVSSMSEKEEKISQDWGFKDAATAHLMLKRAQKMKYKQIRSKKMLDPAVRLALFKNNENKHPSVKPPKKTQPTKVEYFQACSGAEESSHSDDASTDTIARSRDLTYQWLHTQCGEFQETNTKILRRKRFLPELNHDVLNGGRVQLVANVANNEPVDLELVSVKSGSVFGQNRSRHSASSAGRNPITPVKTHSGPQRKERISFRDNPTQLSGGWGSGKKREKMFK